MVKSVLTEKQSQVLNHIRVFRMTTPQIVKDLFFKDETPNAVKSHLRRLADAGYVRHAPLFSQKQRYYYLSPDTARTLFDMDPRTVKPNGPLAMAETYGMLRFCCDGPTRFHKFSRTQFIEEFPNLVIKNVPEFNYYMDSDPEGNRLGHIYVDRGAKATRIVGRIQAVVGKRINHSVWNQEVLSKQNCRFAVGIATLTDRKAEVLQKLLEDEMPEIRFRIKVVRELFLLINKKAERPSA